MVESDDELLQSYKIEIFKEFEKIISLTASCDIKTRCVIIDNDNDQNIIQRCIKSGDCYLKELSGTWEIDSQAIQEVRNDVSVLKICLHHLNYNQKVVHEFSSKKKSTEESIIKSHCCLFCNKLKYFFTRGK